jgi:heme A synthase
LTESIPHWNNPYLVIDQIWVQPAVHLWIGVVVLLSTLLSVVITGFFAWRKTILNPLTHTILLLAQVSLMIQVLVGIKLLDQGLGPLQLYIHYVGGLGAFFFYLLIYWLPKPLVNKRWTAFGLSSFAFLFAFMAFTIGSMYANRGGA